MTTRPDRSRPRNQRRRHFVDASLQGSLVLALLAVEVALFVLALLWIHADLQAVIDERLYRVHQIAPSRPVLMQAIWQVLPWLLAANVLAVWLADRLWNIRLRRILGPLQADLDAAAQLDLRRLPEAEPEHPVLAAASAWLRTERERNLAIRRLADALDPGLDAADPAARERARELVARLREHLP